MRESQVAALADILDRGLVQHARISHIQRSHGAQRGAVRERNGHSVVLEDGVRRCAVCRCLASTTGSLA
eukprot:4456158-Alexandrium_andersonii.AAC.1